MLLKRMMYWSSVFWSMLLNFLRTWSTYKMNLGFTTSITPLVLHDHSTLAMLWRRIAFNLVLLSQTPYFTSFAPASAVRHYIRKQQLRTRLYKPHYFLIHDGKINRSSPYLTGLVVSLYPPLMPLYCRGSVDTLYCSSFTVTRMAVTIALRIETDPTKTKTSSIKKRDLD